MWKGSDIYNKIVSKIKDVNARDRARLNAYQKVSNTGKGFNLNPSTWSNRTRNIVTAGVSPVLATQTFGPKIATAGYVGGKAAIDSLRGFQAKTFGQRASNLGQKLGGYAGTYYMMTGEIPLGTRHLAGAAGFALNPLGALAGVVVGGSKQIGKGASYSWDEVNKLFGIGKEKYNQTFGAFSSEDPLINAVNQGLYGGQLQSALLPYPVDMSVPSTIGGSFSGGGLSVAPSVDVGTPSMDILPWMIALLGIGGAGVGGYYLGKKKRKKKKKRKSKKRKKH